MRTMINRCICTDRAAWRCPAQMLAMCLGIAVILAMTGMAHGDWGSAVKANDHVAGAADVTDIGTARDAAQYDENRGAATRTMQGTGCGDPGAGDCCSANGTPFCDDEECCNLICPQDPFCCDVEWDTLCANAANQQCDVCDGGQDGCGDPGAGDCCQSGGNGTPYCDDEDCCNLICPQDPFCCDVSWDGLCASAAQQQCDVCEGGVDGCGDPGAGDCCSANGTPFCDDEECCNLICPQDPFCCDVEWDNLCANAANQQCDVCGNGAGCGEPGTGDCCQAGGNGTPFCDDEDCCNLICAQDPFCCDVSWDGLCASAAQQQCDVCGNGAGCGDPDAGDCCQDGGNGTPFCDDEECCEQICAQDPFCCDVSWDGLCAGAAQDQCAVCDDGPPPPGDCEGDVTGDGTVGPADLLALVDAWGPCADPENCPADLNGDGVVNIQDLFILLGDWGCEDDGDPEGCGAPDTGDCCVANGTPYCDDEDCCELICGQDPFCCDVEWDTLCANAANDQCEVCDDNGKEGCGEPGTGDCCQAGGNGTPYCDDEDCCNLICAQDPFCCDVSWDGLCASAAQDQCEVCNGNGQEGCGEPGTGDCCQAGGNGTPYCDDEDCCNLICAQDPFCCDVSWDGICASAAQAQCEICATECPSPEAQYQHDCDGTTTNALGLTNGGVIGWAHRFDAGAGDTIDNIATAYGFVDSTTGGVQDGDPVGYAVMTDSGNGPGSVIWQGEAPADGGSVNTDVLQILDVPGVEVSGTFFIVVWVEHSPGTFPSPMDESSPAGLGDEVWLIYTVGGSIDTFDPAAPEAVTKMTDIGFPTAWLLRGNQP